jgi:hypothetical protein
MYDNRTKPGKSVLVLFLVWLACAAYMGMNLKRGWVPWDEGILGQSAERVLNGEMPHRDFDDVYTGGLSYLDALVFRLFGINLMYLRYVLFGFFLLWVPAVYGLAREFLEPWIAAGVTLLAVAWSVPNYPAAMPSWFLLFFATFGTLALSTYINRPKMHWLILAGLCGGSSFLFKTVAIYFIAGGLLFLVFREQDLSRIGDGRLYRTPTYVGFLIVCMALLLLLLVKLVMFPGGVPEFIHFVLPTLALALLILSRESTSSNLLSAERFSTLLASVVPFLMGAALPVLFYFIYYWWHGALTPLFRGLFVFAFHRVQFARELPPGLILEIPAIFAVFIFLISAKLRGSGRQLVSGLLIVAGTLLLVTSASSSFSYVTALLSMRGIIPVIIVSLAILYFMKQWKWDWIDQHTFLLLSITTLFSLIQFPFAHPIYFCYAAPLVVLLGSALLSRLQSPPVAIIAAAFTFYLCFAVLILRHQVMNKNGFVTHKVENQLIPLTQARAGGINVPRDEAAQYDDVIHFVTTVSGGGPIIASPDCPEIYFLAGLRNPTPFLLEFLDTSNYTSVMQRILNQPRFVGAVVINTEPPFSSYARDQLVLLVDKYFQESRTIGSFQVYWRPQQTGFGKKSVLASK